MHLYIAMIVFFNLWSWHPAVVYDITKGVVTHREYNCLCQIAYKLVYSKALRFSVTQPQPYLLWMFRQAYTNILESTSFQKHAAASTHSRSCKIMSTWFLFAFFLIDTSECGRIHDSIMWMMDTDTLPRNKHALDLHSQSLCSMPQNRVLCGYPPL